MGNLEELDKFLEMCDLENWMRKSEKMNQLLVMKLNQ